MPMATQLIVNVKNKPGTLAHLAAALGEAGVNIKAFHAPEVSPRSNRSGAKLRLLVSDLPQARIALRRQKMRFREESVLILSLENRPGALSDVAELLREARINVSCGYCTPSREGRRAIVVLTVSNTKKALSLLRGRSLDEF